MARIVPSQIVEFIQGTLPATIERAAEEGVETLLHRDQATVLLTILEMVESLPTHLWPRDHQAYEDVIFAKAAIRHKITRWENGNDTSALGISRGKRRHPVALIYNALAQCPDDIPSPSTTELAFISDVDLRASIRLDISNATDALGSNEFKSATVLAGAGLEAMLLWAIQQEPAQASAAALARARALGATGITNADPLHWDLGAYVFVARDLGLIGDATATAAGLSRQFRNLIHPGRAARLAQPCNRGTAYAALAAVDLVALDLAARHHP